MDGVLKVRVMAPAVEGAANNALIRLLAEEIGVSRRDVRIVAGATIVRIGRALFGERAHDHDHEHGPGGH